MLSTHTSLSDALVKSKPTKVSELYSSAWIQRTGNWLTDNRIGADLADKVMDVVRAEQCPAKLWFLVKLLMAEPNHDGMHIGFFHRISELAMRE